MTGYPILFIGDAEPSGSPSDGWIWVDTANKVIKVFEGYADGVWVEKPLTVPVDIDFTGKVKVDGKRGETVNIAIPSVGTLKFKEGIMHKFESV